MNTHSTTAAEALFEAFPEWRQFARTETSEDGGSYLVVEVPAPPEAKVEHGLVIDTSNEEVTVGFDCYHTHFDDWVGDGEHFGTHAALQFISQVVSERVAVVSWWFNDVWRGSAQLDGDAKPDVPDWVRKDAINRIRVRSWRGSLNADIDA